MTALFCALAGKGAGGIDQGDDGQAKPIGQIHQADGFAIAFWPRHAKIAGDARFGIMPFFMTDDHNRAVTQTGQPAHDGMIIGKITIPGQRGVFLEQLFNIIFTMGPIRMARHLAFTPRGELGIKLIEQGTRFFVQRFGLSLNVHILIITAHSAQLFSLAFDFC